MDEPLARGLGALVQLVLDRLDVGQAQVTPLQELGARDLDLLLFCVLECAKALLVDAAVDQQLITSDAHPPAGVVHVHALAGLLGHERLHLALGEDLEPGVLERLWVDQLGRGFFQGRCHGHLKAVRGRVVVVERGQARERLTGGPGL